MNKRILVIDDQENILEDFQIILSPDQSEEHDLETLQAQAAKELLGICEEIETPEHYEITTARQGKEGFEIVKQAIAKKKPFAIAFIDIRMPPGWDGVKTASEIRKIDPAIEIVIVTAYSDQSRKEIVKNVGCPARLLYLKKPFDVEEIKQLALSLTEKWDLQKKEKEHRHRLESLLKTITTIKTYSGDSQKILTMVMQEVMAVVEADTAFVISIGDHDYNIEARAGNLSDDEMKNIVSEIPSDSLKSGQIICSGPYSLLPLRTEFIEVIIAFGSQLKEDDMPFMELFLESASELIKNARLFEKNLLNEKIASVGLATRTIVHDLKNPIMLILSSLELSLMQPNLSEKLKKWINSAISGTNRIKEMITDIADYTLGRVHLDRRKISISSFVAEVIILWSEQLKKKSIALTVDIPEDIEILVDKARFHRVLDNLINNAVDAMEDSKAKEITICARIEPDKTTLMITDTGKGIPKEILPKVFEPFQTYGKKKGIGLGMGIVQNFVQLHNGSIRLESSPKGTTCYIELPR